MQTRQLIVSSYLHFFSSPPPPPLPLSLRELASLAICFYFCNWVAHSSVDRVVMTYPSINGTCFPY